MVPHCRLGRLLDCCSHLLHYHQLPPHQLHLPLGRLRLDFQLLDHHLLGRLRLDGLLLGLQLLEHHHLEHHLLEHHLLGHWGDKDIQWLSLILGPSQL